MGLGTGRRTTGWTPRIALVAIMVMLVSWLVGWTAVAHADDGADDGAGGGPAVADVAQEDPAPGEPDPTPPPDDADDADDAEQAAPDTTEAPAEPDTDPTTPPSEEAQDPQDADRAEQAAPDTTETPAEPDPESRSGSSGSSGSSGAAARRPIVAAAAVIEAADKRVEVPRFGSVDVDLDALVTYHGTGGYSLSVTVFPTRGTVSLSGGVAHFTAGWLRGEDHFEYLVTANDGSLAMATGTVTIVIDPTHIIDDSYAITSGEQLRGNVLSNDVPAGGLFIFSITRHPAHGVLDWESDGSFTYTPEAGFVGTDSFVYFASRNPALPGGTGFAAASITVQAPADPPPTAVDDTVTTAEDVPATGNVLTNDTGQGRWAQLWEAPVNGTVVQNRDGSFVYTPRANFHGVDTFVYRVSTADDAFDDGTVTITVTPVNDPPTTMLGTLTTQQGTPGAIDVAPLISDVDGDPLTVSSPTGPLYGTVSLAGTTITYTPGAFNPGFDSIDYTVSDGDSLVVGTVNVVIEDAAAPGQATDDTYVTAEDTVLSANVLSNDLPAGDVSASQVMAPTHGVLALSADGSFTYHPDQNFHGTDSFTYLAFNEHGSDTGTATITVTSVNDPPTAVDRNEQVAQDDILRLDLDWYVADADGDTLTVATASDPQHGNVSMSGTVVTYRPATGYVGADSFTYRVSDGKGGVATATISVSVAAYNKGIEAANTSVSTPAATPVTVDVAPLVTSGYDYQVAVALSNSGAVSVSGTAVTFTPDPGDQGVVMVDYEVTTLTEPLVYFDWGTIAVDVGSPAPPADEPPTTGTDSYRVPAGGTLTVTAAEGVLANDVDINETNGDALPAPMRTVAFAPLATTLTASLAASPRHGTLTLNADGSFRYTPRPGYTGPDTFAYTATNGAATSAAQVVRLSVYDPSTSASTSTSTDVDPAAPVAVLPATGAPVGALEFLPLSLLLMLGGVLLVRRHRPGSGAVP